MMAKAQTFIPVRIARAKKPPTFIPVRIAPAMCQNSNESAAAPRPRIRGKPRRSPVEATAEAQADAKADAMAEANAEAKAEEKEDEEEGGRTVAAVKAEPSTRLRKKLIEREIEGPRGAAAPPRKNIVLASP